MGKFLYQCCIGYKTVSIVAENLSPKKATMPEQETPMTTSRIKSKCVLYSEKKKKPYNLRTEEKIHTTVLMSSIDPCVLDVSLSKLLKASSVTLSFSLGTL